MKEWWSISDLAALQHPSFPKTLFGLRKFADERDWNDDCNRCREVEGNGGTRREYFYTILPKPVIDHIIAKHLVEEAELNQNDERSELISETLWLRFGRSPGSCQEEAKRRLLIVQRVAKLRETQQEGVAMALVETKTQTPQRTLYRWMDAVRGLHKNDWLPALLPDFKGRTATAPCDTRAFDFLVSDYLRPSEPSFASSYERMKEAAEANGWSPIPSKPTLKRRIEKEIGQSAIVLARKGQAEAAKLYPAQTRDRTVFHAMEAVNADGHVFDVFVKFDDGSIGRPCLIGFQDVYSGMVLSHRISRTENKETTRLAIADMIESWGIPDHVYFDNGRAFMSKWITGGMKHRFRFKVKEEEPKGVLTQLGVEVHNTTPYHGQAKPIERAWRDMVDRISRHPEVDGAFTGNHIDAKPENYRSRAIPIDEFRKFVAEQIMRHNARADRNTQTAKGRSFAAVFKESLEQPGVIVRKATALQRQFFLLAGEGKTARRGNGEIHLADNRYWSEHLIAYAGKKLMVRFDPENLHDDLFVYTMDGVFIDRAPCIEAVGFNDAEAAREHAKLKREFLKAQREVLRLGRLLTPAQVAAKLPKVNPDVIEHPKVVGLHTETTAHTTLSDTSISDAFGRGLAASLGVSSIFDHPSNQKPDG